MDDGLSTLTLYPEHAELFRLGLRTVETRTRRTNHRGRLLLHAGKRDPDSKVALSSPRSLAALDAIRHFDAIPMGVIVASCLLVECAPIVEHTGMDDNPVEVYSTYDGRDLAIQRVIGDPSRAENVTTEWITEQLPFGDWTPGRYAWILADVVPTAERCPACWPPDLVDGKCPAILGHGPGHQSKTRCVETTPGHVVHWGGRGSDREWSSTVRRPYGQPITFSGAFDETPDPCPVCSGSGKPSAPIPARGKQGLWRWSP